MQRINVLEELISETGYQVALFTTFSVDLVFFEKMIVRHLIEKNCTHIGLMVDQKLLKEAITKPNISELGKTYIIKGMESNQAFHPKIYLLLGEAKAKVIIGSGNITPAGLVTNYEVFNTFTYDESIGELSDLPEIQSAYNILYSLHHGQDNKMWNALYTKTEEFKYLQKSIQRDSKLLNNLNQPLQEQLDKLLPEDIYQIECFVPYFDRSLAVINKWNEIYLPDLINIYIQEKHSNFPRHIECDANVSLFKATFSKDPHKRYHGKVFRFIGKEKEVIVYGSANCSRQAFLNVYQHGGNAESIILEEGINGEFDNFFTENIYLESLPTPLPIEFETMQLAEENDFEGNEFKINFVDGIIEDKKLIITIKSTTKIDGLLIGDEKGRFIRLENNYSTYTFSKNIDLINSTFQLFAYKKEIKISIVGWCHNYLVLNKTFNNLKGYVDYHLSPNNFFDDYFNVLALLDDLNNRLILTMKDLSQNQHQNITSSIHQQAELSNTQVPLSADEEDYYVNVEENYVYGSIGSKDVLGNLINVLLKSFTDENNKTVNIDGQKHKSTPSTEMNPNETTEIQNEIMKRMRRFMKKFNKGITSNQYLETVKVDVFIKNAIIYSAFIFKFKEKLGKEFLTVEESMDQCLEIIIALVYYSEKNILDISRADMRMLLIQSLATIYAKERDISQTEENLFTVRKELERLKSVLKKMHQQIYPININLKVLTAEVIQFLRSNFEIYISENTYQEWFKGFFPLITLSQFKEMIEREGIVIRETFSADIPIILLEKEVKNSAEFNLKQLQILNLMLVVEEWEYAGTFKIRWFNNNPELPLKRYVLYYNEKKRILKKKYVYKESSRKSLIEYKENVFKVNLKDSIRRGDASILGQGFKKLTPKV